MVVSVGLNTAGLLALLPSVTLPLYYQIRHQHLPVNGLITVVGIAVMKLHCSVALQQPVLFRLFRRTTSGCLLF